MNIVNLSSFILYEAMTRRSSQDSESSNTTNNSMERSIQAMTSMAIAITQHTAIIDQQNQLRVEQAAEARGMMDFQLTVDWVTFCAKSLVNLSQMLRLIRNKSFCICNTDK